MGAHDNIIPGERSGTNRLATLFGTKTVENERKSDYEDSVSERKLLSGSARGLSRAASGASSRAKGRDVAPAFGRERPPQFVIPLAWALRFRFRGSLARLSPRGTASRLRCSA